MLVGARTDIGLVRKTNEDGFPSEGNLFAVADGIGSHQAKEMAEVSLPWKVLAEFQIDGLRPDKDYLRRAFERSQ